MTATHTTTITIVFLLVTESSFDKAGADESGVSANCLLATLPVARLLHVRRMCAPAMMFAPARQEDVLPLHHGRGRM